MPIDTTSRPAALLLNVGSSTALKLPREKFSEDEQASFPQQWSQTEDRLDELARDSDVFEDEGLETPSQTTVALAHDVTKILRDLGRIPPLRAVPDSHGGIVFERQDEHCFESIRIAGDGTVEYCKFFDGKLIDRQPWL